MYCFLFFFFLVTKEYTGDIAGCLNLCSGAWIGCWVFGGSEGKTDLGALAAEPPFERATALVFAHSDVYFLTVNKTRQSVDNLCLLPRVDCQGCVLPLLMLSWRKQYRYLEKRVYAVYAGKGACNSTAVSHFGVLGLPGYSNRVTLIRLGTVSISSFQVWWSILQAP